ncbi:MAG TPA: hypothetical protein VFR90_16445 [Methylibium sp.]|uniref:hypothetical protein n=1 Tax=Methylibium sp. TaxID=2067992 RepID=UPI002DB97709|nr:hypothetical protein [Methylibium sp.]HEU4460711.1 hypothetical protein [Methylibium sp.]
MKSLPKSSKELNDALVGIFPAFSGGFEELASSVTYEKEEISFHALMREFTYFFGKGIDSFSEKQLEELGDLLVRATRSKGPLENAIDTCFLEHAKKIKVNRKLARWLSKARAKHGA